MKIFSVRVDVTKIDKTRLYKGKKGTYLTLSGMIKDEPDQYGNDVVVWEGQTEDERKNKKDRNFLGNGKVVYEEQPVQEEKPDNKSNELPF